MAVNVHLDQMAEVVFARFLHCKVTPFPPFYATEYYDIHILFGRKSLCVAYT